MTYAVTVGFSFALAFLLSHALAPILGSLAPSIGLFVLGMCLWLNSRFLEKKQATDRFTKSLKVNS